MKKLLLLLLVGFSISLASFSQDDKTKVKKTSTVPQKVHNTFSKHKKYKGYKTKTKKGNRVHKTKVNNKTGEVKEKTENK
jgi:hypothetical protein